MTQKRKPTRQISKAKAPPRKIVVDLSGAVPWYADISRPRMSSITLGELDRAMTAYKNSLKSHPGMDAKAVFAALKSFEHDRRLLDPKGSR